MLTGVAHDAVEAFTSDIYAKAVDDVDDDRAPVIYLHK